DEPHAGFAAPLPGRGCHFADHQPAHITPVASWVCASVQIDTFDEGGVEHARPGCEVIQYRHHDAVEEIADVARRRPAHVEVGNAADDGGDPREHFDGAERIAKGAGQLTNFGLREAAAHARALALHHDLDAGLSLGEFLRSLGVAP